MKFWLKWCTENDNKHGDKTLPIEDQDKWSQKANEHTEMTIIPDSDREAQNHDSNNQDVGNTI